MWTWPRAWRSRRSGSSRKAVSCTRKFKRQAASGKRQAASGKLQVKS
ncbi:AraC family transcriptional regulator [Pseudomonas marginalis]|uniref:AraC family transcriptional regulator n=1 Tax=Pseudomonas marginalis TaxID=298 RepID=A0A9X9FZD8_PSEMA|nr:AraC family transcriptional regulator [Pseudomonas marginalis]